MTRETKLGLVVASSFLALVGGVVVARLKQIDMPGDVAEAVANTEVEKTPIAPPTPVANAQPAPAANAPGSPPERHKNPVSSDAVANAGGAKMPSPDQQPAPVAAAVQQPPPVSAPVVVNPLPAPAEVVAQPVKPMEVIPPAIPVEPKPDPAQFVGPLPQKPGEEPSPAVVANPPMTPPEKSLTAPAAPDRPIMPAPEAAAPVPAVVDANPPKQDAPPAPAPVVVVPANPAPIPEMPAPPPASPVPTVIKQPAVAEPGAPPPPLNASVANNAVPTVAIVPASGGPNTPAALDAPRVPVAGPARAAVVAPTRPAIPPEPRRDSYLEEQYRWSAGDNFAGLSTKYYMTPKYADALLKYNQDYPLASREMRQSPPAVNPGQVIWVPPVRILERDYAARIDGLTPVVPATPTSRPTVEPVAPPPGLANSGFGNAGGQLYRVRAPGESVQEIARRTLGNSALSGRVQQLNPSLSPDPRLPIPAGAVLRLPGDARVDAADKP